MKNIRFVLTLVILMIAALLATACGGPKPVATVNDEKITQAQLDKKVEQLKAYSTQQGASFAGEEGKAFLEGLKRQALDDMEMEILVLGEAKKQKTEVATSEVDKYFNDTKATSFKTDKEYQDFLTANKLTTEELKAAIKYQLTGQKLYEKLTKDVVADEKEVKAYFEENKAQFQDKVKVSHILILAQKPEDFPKAETKALDILTKLNNGGDFKKLATENSEDPGSKDAGGYFDQEFSVDDPGIDPGFAKGAFELKNIGDISKAPVKSSYGYHIIKLEEKIPGADLKTQGDVIKIQASQVKKNTFFQAYLDKVKKAAKITENLPAETSKTQQPAK